MKIVGIFEKVNGRLFTAKFDTCREDELDRAFTSWRDTDALRHFFLTYRSDLLEFNPQLKVRSAMDVALEEAEEIFTAIAKAAVRDEFHKLFKPLDNRELELHYELQKLKARGTRSKSMLRLYAIKFMDRFIVCGSALKITEKMNRPHLKVELYKLELLKKYLQVDGIENDFVYLDIEPE